MENKTMVSNKVEFACDLADQMLDLDYYEKLILTDSDGNESYCEDTQYRFEQFYSVIMEALDNAKAN
tara:strand:+ start:397 stop:597 length:201 start_codon:yes stop_codon:yes gene_type:complete